MCLLLKSIPLTSCVLHKTGLRPGGILPMSCGKDIPPAQCHGPILGPYYHTFNSYDETLTLSWDYKPNLGAVSWEGTKQCLDWRSFCSNHNLAGLSGFSIFLKYPYMKHTTHNPRWWRVEEVRSLAVTVIENATRSKAFARYCRLKVSHLN